MLERGGRCLLQLMGAVCKRSSYLTEDAWIGVCTESSWGWSEAGVVTESQVSLFPFLVVTLQPPSPAPIHTPHTHTHSLPRNQCLQTRLWCPSQQTLPVSTASNHMTPTGLCLWVLPSCRENWALSQLSCSNPVATCAPGGALESEKPSKSS